jgi:hypothetical protein
MEGETLGRENVLQPMIMTLMGPVIAKINNLGTLNDGSILTSPQASKSPWVY